MKPPLMLRASILVALLTLISCPLLTAGWVEKLDAKSAEKINAKLKAGHEVAWLIEASVSADGDLAVLFAARAKGTEPASFPDLVKRGEAFAADVVDDAWPNGGGQVVMENVVVSLKEKRVFGRVELEDPWRLYFPGRNHASFKAIWGPAKEGSRFGILDFGGRFGSLAVVVVEMEGEGQDSKFTQTDIGERVEKSLDSGPTSFYFRLGPERKIRVRAVATTNPKQLESQKTSCALFQGTFDLESKQWIATDTRPITSKQYDALSSAYQDISDLTGHMTVGGNPAPKNLTWSIGFGSEKEKADYLDRIMNNVYQAVRLLLPSNRFTEMKQDQIAWLKTRDAAHSITGKSKPIEDRIKTLQDLLW